MVTKEKLKNTITVGFLDTKIEEKLKVYTENFDIVLTDNSDFKELLEIISI